MEQKHIPWSDNGIASELTPPHCVAMDSFGELLSDLMDEHGVKSLRSFAKHFGRSHTQIRLIIADEVTPNPEWVEEWARYFKLVGSERERFVQLANSSRAKGKKDTAKYVDNLERTVERLRTELGQAVNALEELSILLQDKGLKIPNGLVKIVSDLKKRLGPPL